MIIDQAGQLQQGKRIGTRSNVDHSLIVNNSFLTVDLIFASSRRKESVKNLGLYMRSALIHRGGIYIYNESGMEVDWVNGFGPNNFLPNWIGSIWADFKEFFNLKLLLKYRVWSDIALPFIPKEKRYETLYHCRYSFKMQYWPLYWYFGWYLKHWQ